ncbi:probable ATP-dependent helicase DinG homolog [Acidimicrobiaceae bacterium]|nr:probable ATP-dependent helicase DinG homolog [Acidimicrobiaceae bacterium]
MPTNPADQEILDALHQVTQTIKNSEERQGQDEMAVLVGRALRNDRHLIVQAGTGTGKTLGYLVPAVKSGRRVVVSTVTKALQDQLSQNDLPLLASALNETLDHPLTWTVLKGRSNYLCKQRIAELADRAQSRLELGDVSVKTKADIKKLIEWSNITQTGDEGELDWQPQRQAWSMVSVTSEECPGASRCPQGDSCFAERMRTQSQTSDIVVVNGWLYALDINAEGTIIGEHDVVIFDEAHELEDVVSDSSGLAISPSRITGVGSSMRAIIRDDALSANFAKSASRLRDQLAPLLNQRIALPIAGELREILNELRGRVNEALESLRTIATSDDSAKQRKLRAQSLCTRFVGDLDLALQDRAGYVAYVSGTTERCSLEMRPLDVGPALYESVWSQRTAILTSATIPTNLPARIGLPAEQFDVHDVASPFDYENHALLYCAAHLPDPAQGNRDKAVHGEIEQLINAAGGRTLALFTSYARLNAAYSDLSERLDFEILKQDDLPKMELLRKFAESESRCLFATQSFFQGVDVPGSTLSLVIIDRLPFPVPTDPLMSARREVHGKSAFTAIDIPIVATKLAQASGRLIRTQTDLGVVAVLDPRLVTKGYGKTIIAMLPPMEFTKSNARAQEFLNYAVSNL